MKEKKLQPDKRFECGDKNCKFYIDIADGGMKVTAEPREKPTKRNPQMTVIEEVKQELAEIKSMLSGMIQREHVAEAAAKVSMFEKSGMSLVDILKADQRAASLKRREARKCK